jgi:hypothetical protein
MRENVTLELGMNDSNEPTGFDLTISVRTAKDKTGAPFSEDSPIIAVVCGAQKHKNVAKIMDIDDILLAEDSKSKVEIRYVRFVEKYEFQVKRL